MLVGVDVAVSVAVAVGVAVAVAVGVGVALGVAVGVATGPLPVPLRLTVCGLAASPTALTPIVALSAPSMLGVNFSVYVHDAPAPDSDDPQVPPVTAKSAKLAPPTLSLNETAAPPSLITVTVLFGEGWPPATVPKAMLAGTTLTGVTPVPLSAIAAGPPLGSSATKIESEPLSAASLLGVNVTA